MYTGHDWSVSSVGQYTQNDTIEFLIYFSVMLIDLFKFEKDHFPGTKLTFAVYILFYFDRTRQSK